MFSREKIEQFKSVPTPFYYYDLNLLDATLNEISKEADAYDYKVHYALKANSNDELLNLISEHGLGADCVSGNEILRALDTGFEYNTWRRRLQNNELRTMSRILLL